MATDTHIKFDGVEGESTHQDHKGEIEVLSWSWGVQNASSVGAAGGSGKGKATPGEFHFTHTYDKASPVLAKKCAQGVHFPTVVMTARKAGEGQKDFLKVTMKEVFVSTVQPSGGGGGDLMESVSMSYASVEFSYKAQDSKGSLGGEVKFSWDTKTTKIA
jgi:type VI secretion system secreted protein Hcp